MARIIPRNGVGNMTESFLAPIRTTQPPAPGPLLGMIFCSCNEDMEENSEVILKYQKLALEYSKLKAQTSVLKTAISEEQGVVHELQDTLKKNDQLIRKLEQEVECLNFRNVQLAKRVSVLQNELEAADTSSRHSKVVTASNQGFRWSVEVEVPAGPS
ncbi:Protein phosphatase 1 regulatory subunit 21 [Araneus ventricosus]|uniref:Protein phosphatase 1 regulatory subunit 21 n=1 Tax=Araneus ventricosus TaxID=182803 RepID=A0A4Y2LZL0_ARAVE|nr:Protein phosphatase 1 regulatory subunit 21 [Araneus ventricosus]